MNQYDRTYSYIACELAATRNELAKVRSELTKYQDRTNTLRSERFLYLCAFVSLENTFGLYPPASKDPGIFRRVELATHYKGSPESYMAELYGVSTTLQP